MILRQVTECSKNLDFAAGSNWPLTFPALAWRGHLINEFQRDTGMVLDWPNGNLTELVSLLRMSYPRLGLGGAARLATRLESTFSENFVNLVLEASQFRQDSDSIAILKVLAPLPRTFHDWLDERQVSPRELSPLLSLSLREINALEIVLCTITQLNLSKQNGLRIIEWSVDLIRIHGENLKWPKAQDSQSYLDALWKLRFPMTSARDEKVQKSCEQLPWPKRTSGKMLRQGDENILRVEISAHSEVELQKRISELSQFSKAEEIADLWKV